MISSTIKSSGGTFSTMQGWENAIAGTDDETGSCESSAALQTTTLTCSAGAGHTYLLTADASNRIAAVTYAGLYAKARITTSASAAIVFSSSGFIIDGIGIAVTSVGSTLALIYDTANSSFTIRNCLFYSDQGTYTWYFSGSGTRTIINVGFFGAVNGGNFIQSEAGTTTVHQSTFTSAGNPHKGMSRDGGTFNCYGVIVVRLNTVNVSDFAGTIGGDYNVSKDTTAPGANSVVSATGVLVSQTHLSENLALNSGSWKGIVNRSGFPTETDYDILGTSRPSTGADPGCWQTASSTTSIIGSSSFSFAPAGVIGAKGRGSASSTIAFAPAGSIGAKGRGVGSAAVSFAPVGSIGAKARGFGSSALSFAPVGAIGAKGAGVGSSALSFSPTGSIGAKGRGVGSSALSFSPVGSIGAKARGVGSATLTFSPTGSSALTTIGSATLSFSPTGSIGAKGRGIGSATLTFAPTGIIQDKDRLSGTATISFAPAGSIRGKTSLLGSSSLSFSTQSVLVGRLPGVGTASFSFNLTGVGKAKGVIVGSASLTFSSAASLRGMTSLVGLTTITFTTTSSSLVIYELLRCQLLEDAVFVVEEGAAFAILDQ